MASVVSVPFETPRLNLGMEGSLILYVQCPISTRMVRANSRFEFSKKIIIVELIEGP